MSHEVTTPVGISVFPLILLAAILVPLGWLAAKRRWKLLGGIAGVPLVLLLGLVTVRVQSERRSGAARPEPADVVEEAGEESARLEAEIRDEIRRLRSEVRGEAERIRVAGTEPPGIGDMGTGPPVPAEPAGKASIIAADRWVPEYELCFETPGFEAELHPSLEAAARSLARSSARAIEQRSASPGRGFLPGWQQVLEEAILSRVAELSSNRAGASAAVTFAFTPPAAMSATMPEAIPGDSAAPDPVAVRLTLRAGGNYVPEIGDRAGVHPTAAPAASSGTLRVELADGRLLDRQTAFVSKPWLTDPAGVGSRRPGQRWIVGISQDGRTTVDEAESAALQAAAVRLARELRPRLSFAASRLLDEAALVEQVARLAPVNGMVLDRFVQGVKRPYGDFWRCAVLVDASPRAVEGLAREVGLGFEAARNSWLRVVASFGGLVGLIAATYLLLNAATRGYYVWSIRVLCGLGLLGGIAVVLSLAA